MADEMPANTPPSDSTASTPETDTGPDSRPETDLSPEVVAVAAAALAPIGEGHAVEEGKYDASAIQVLEGLDG